MLTRSFPDPDPEQVSNFIFFFRNSVPYTVEFSVPGELPPLPSTCFGRDELIKNIISCAENLIPVALIGAGGIGKTSITLTVLHDDRIRQRFGDNRRFIRCDQFPVSLAHFLARLSKVIGAGIENPEDLTPLRPSLSSREMILFLDNVESILDPQGTDAREIYDVVEELSRFSNICLGITSRISTVPPRCRRPIIPTLSIESSCNIFYDIYNSGGRSDVISNLVKQLDFHALSVTLLATAAPHNMWDYDRLTKEWNAHRGQVLRTDYNESLAATIELSLASPTFRSLGADTRELLGVVAFFPQGVDENSLDWLFPTISNRKLIFDKFCVLSLAHRSNGRFTMLAPIRDYLCPRDPTSSPLLCITKERYFNRLSVDVAPEKPGFGEARWIKSEDVNVEHLLNVFASLDGNSDDVWYTCSKFIRHLYWHKRRGTVLGSAIEGLPDDHRFKRDCLFELSRLPGVIGNHSEQKRLLSSLLVLERGRGDDKWVAHILVTLSRANWKQGLRTEGMQQLKEALKTYKRLGNTVDQANCLLYLTRLLENDKQLDAAEQAASQAIELLPKRGQEFRVCQSHRFLGNIYRSKGEREKAIHHFEVALGIASPLNWHSEIYWIHDSLARLLSDEGKFDDASNHIEQAKSHAVDDAYDLGYAMKQQAKIWYRQSRLEEARSEALRAIEILENLGAAKDVEACETLLRDIEETMEGKVNYINLLVRPESWLFPRCSLTPCQYAAQHHVYGFSSHY